MKKYFGILSTAVCLTLALLLGGAVAPVCAYQDKTQYIDNTTRLNPGMKVTLADIIAFAENMTNKMLRSPVFAEAKNKPRVILGNVANNTHDENLRIMDIYDRIQEVLFNSGVVRVLDPSATSFDYIINPEIISITSRDADNNKRIDYSMKIRMYDVKGELVGHWSDDLSMFREGQ